MQGSDHREPQCQAKIVTERVLKGVELSIISSELSLGTVKLGVRCRIN